jgi:hypothetical protein
LLLSASLRFALRASLRLFEIVPDDFIAVFRLARHPRGALFDKLFGGHGGPQRFPVAVCSVTRCRVCAHFSETKTHRERFSPFRNLEL